jgi:fatty-acyl-CoA synthase
MLKTAHLPAESDQPVARSTVGGILRAAADRDGQAPALVESRAGVARVRRWTYRELLAEAEATAQALLRRFAPGDHVAVWAPNSAEWLILEFGIALAGMVLVTVNPAFKAAEVRHVLAASRASGLFLVAEYRGNPMREVLDSLRGQLPELREVIDFADLAEFVRPGGEPVAEPMILPEVQPSAIAQIQFTSGTTGAPKAAMLTHCGITNNARLAFGRLGYPPGSSALHALPLFHTGGAIMLALGPVQNQWVHVLIDSFDPGRMLKLIETEQVDVLFGVPTMFAALLEHRDFPKRDLTSLKAVFSAGASITPTLVRKLEKFLTAEYMAMFAQTEASGVVTATSFGDSDEVKATTVGRPLPNTEVKIVKPDGAHGGKAVGIGEVGELLVRGYGVMDGYFELSEASRATVETDGWLHTGDLCTMDEAGNLRVVGRIKEMIIRGGENIFPPEIEKVLSAHPAVAEAAVVGVPDERWGEQVAAFVRLDPGADVDAEDLAAFTRERLASAKCPRIWRTVDTFPLTASGKIQKFRLRESWVEGMRCR